MFAPALLGIAACGENGGDAGPGAVSEGEAQALDEAAEMLDARAPPDEAEPGPSPELTGDSE
ncbi:MAG: hypothetical protein AAGL68_02730 [Pseudomonadota bacterium]